MREPASKTRLIPHTLLPTRSSNVLAHSTVAVFLELLRLVAVNDRGRDLHLDRRSICRYHLRRRDWQSCDRYRHRRQ